MVMTAKEFAEKHGVEYVLANNFLRLLEEAGVIRQAGVRSTGGRGKGSNLYDVPEKITLDLSKRLKAA